MKYNLNFRAIPYITLPFFFCSMPLHPIRLNRFTSTMAQTTRFGVRKCLLEVALIRYDTIRYTFRGQNPQKPKILEPECQISSQINTLEQLLNELKRDRRKISTHSLYKIGVGESNGNVIFGLGRHLAAKTTSGPILKIVKIANNL